MTCDDGVTSAERECLLSPLGGRVNGGETMSVKSEPDLPVMVSGGDLRKVISWVEDMADLRNEGDTMALAAARRLLMEKFVPMVDLARPSGVPTAELWPAFYTFVDLFRQRGDLDADQRGILNAVIRQINDLNSGRARGRR